MDIASISAALTSIKAATDIAKFIKDSDVSLEKAETKLKLADLIVSLADARIQITDIKEALLEKESEIRTLGEKLKIRESIKWEAPYYWLILPDGKDGPYCQHCYDKNQELLRLQGYNNGYWDCKSCKSDYRDKTFDSLPMISSVSHRSTFYDE